MPRTNPSPPTVATCCWGVLRALWFRPWLLVEVVGPRRQTEQAVDGAFHSAGVHARRFECRLESEAVDRGEDQVERLLAFVGPLRCGRGE